MNRNRCRAVALRALLAAACLALALLPACQSALAVVIKPSSDAADRLSHAKAAIRDRALGRYGMVPIYGRDVADGVYDVRVESTSAFFRITSAQLIVDGDDMTARITLGSLSYLYVYMGTAEAAGSAPEADRIPGEAGEHETVFTIPVPALNAPFECAAYSRNRQRWYDRLLLVDAASLPEDALAFELPDYALAERAILAYGGGDDSDEASSPAEAAVPEPVALPRSDGEYAIEVNLSGGSGRASVSSPTLLVVRDGLAYARLLWSSPYYDYMIVGGAVYENLTTDGGNSTFEIPITAMDAPMPVVADTTAMGDPIEIDYTLTFYSESIGDKSQIPQEAAKKVLAISLAIIVGGAALNYFVKKKRK